LITAVDTNVLLDIFAADARFGPASAGAARQCLGEGALIACEAVWAETATAFQSSDKFRRAMADLEVTFESLSEGAAVKALRRPGVGIADAAAAAPGS
jgi:hypothetical protein